MKQILKYCLQTAIAMAITPIKLLPVRKNRVLFMSLEGGANNEYDCNPKYFCEYLLTNRPDRYEIIWLMMHPENYAHLKHKGIKMAKHFTLKGFYYALTSKIVISNGGYFTWFPFRKSQLCINTWHAGGAYKRLENDTKGANKLTLRRMKFAADHIDLYLSSCEMFTKTNIQQAFLYDKAVLDSGLPRNDLLLSKKRASQVYRKFRIKYALPEDARILMFAPTFRSGEGGTYEPLNVAEILAHLNTKTGHEWYFINHSHAKSDGTELISNPGDHCLEISDRHDTQHLLCACDALISDYSSIIWDFALTGKPLLLYTPDLESYLKGRGFYVDIHEWGFPICNTMEELLLAIDTTSERAYADNAAKHLKLLGSYEDGHACQTLLNYIEHSL